MGSTEPMRFILNASGDIAIVFFGPPHPHEIIIANIIYINDNKVSYMILLSFYF